MKCRRSRRNTRALLRSSAKQGSAKAFYCASSENVYVMTASCQAIEQQVAFAPLVAMLSAWLLEASEEQLQTLPILALSPVATLVPELVRRLPGIVPLSPVAPEQAYSMLIGGLVDLLVALS